MNILTMALLMNAPVVPNGIDNENRRQCSGCPNSMVPKEIRGSIVMNSIGVGTLNQSYRRPLREVQPNPGVRWKRSITFTRVLPASSFSFFLLCLLLIVMAGCSSGTKTTKDRNTVPEHREAPAELRAPSYDPPGSTVTTGRTVEPPRRRVVTYADVGVSVSTEFDGARLTNFFRITPLEYLGVVAPENVPINNSPWYAFKIWSRRPETIRLTLNYRDGNHRYRPKISSDGVVWRNLDDDRQEVDSLTGEPVLLLDIGPDTLWVAAQELITSDDMINWIGKIAALPWATADSIGASLMGRPIIALRITETSSPDYIFVVGRQHPPEVTGTIAMKAFVEAVAGTSSLARAFRRQFNLVAIPLMNPDGVDAGNWRHSMGGVDLNRDWVEFNQPETRTTRKEFLRIRDSLKGKGWFALDFHSTYRDLIYTLDTLPTIPYGFTDRWLTRLQERLPDYHPYESPSPDLGEPVAKNWFYREFGIPAVTYEVGDATSRDNVRRIATAAAMTMMELLLEEKGYPESGLQENTSR